MACLAPFPVGEWLGWEHAVLEKEVRRLQGLGRVKNPPLPSVPGDNAAAPKSRGQTVHHSIPDRPGACFPAFCLVSPGFFFFFS